MQRINVTITTKHATGQQRKNVACFRNPGICFYLQLIQELTDEYWVVNLHVSSLYCIKSPGHILCLFRNNPFCKQSDLIWPKPDFHTCEQLPLKTVTHQVWVSCSFTPRQPATRAGGLIQLPGSVKSHLVQDNYTGLEEACCSGNRRLLHFGPICNLKQ